MSHQLEVERHSQKERDYAAGTKRYILVVLCVSIMIFSGMGIVHAQLATLNPAANVTDTSAQLSGFVDPNGHDTSWYLYVWPGVTYNESPPTCGEGSLPWNAGNTPVSCTAQGLTPSTTYTFELNADWPGMTMTAGEPPNQGSSGWLQFTTLPAAPSFDFTMTVSPGSVSVTQGGTAHYAVGVMYSDPSYAGTMINVQLTGLGPGMDYNLLQSGDLTVTTSPMTPTGSYSIVLMGYANGVTHQTGLTLIVTSSQTTTTAVTTTAVTSTSSSTPFDYSVTISPSSQTVMIGGTTAYVVTVLPVVGSPVPVSLTVTGLPADVRNTFTVSSGNPPYTSTLNLDLSTSTAPVGAYTLTVVASMGGNMKTATATLMIQPKASQTTTSQTSTSGSGWSDVLQQNLLPVLVLFAVVLGILGFTLGRRGRGQRVITQPTGSQIFCAKCGMENPASNEFCRGCGSKLKNR